MSFKMNKIKVVNSLYIFYNSVKRYAIFTEKHAEKLKTYCTVLKKIFYERISSLIQLKYGTSN